MSKFKARPELRALPDPDAVARFAAGADSHATTVDVDDVAPTPLAEVAPASSSPVKAPPAAKLKLPWQKYDKDARPLSGINLRLNDYEHELLKHLASEDDRSLQQTIKRLLIPAAEAAAEALRRK